MDTNDVDKWIAEYIMARDMMKELKEKQEAERAPLQDFQDERAKWIREFMVANNITENLKSKSGTFWVSVKQTATLADPDAFMRFVIESEKFELIERRANVTAVKDFVTENNMLPPGCNLKQVETHGARRPTEK